MIAIRGAGSQIAVALQDLLPAGESALAVPRTESMPFNADRYLFCAGILRPKRESEQTDKEIEEGLSVNFWRVKNECDQIISLNHRARICVIGSESAFVGSYDDVYAQAKARLHEYVSSKRLLSPLQQLVCIAPGVIGDAGMCVRRTDTGRLERRRAAHPKQRFLTSAEVAALVYHVLYVDKGYLSGVVLRMNGGEHTI